jgi:hypothetical protein
MMVLAWVFAGCIFVAGTKAEPAPARQEAIDRLTGIERTVDQVLQDSGRAREAPSPAPSLPASDEHPDRQAAPDVGEQWVAAIQQISTACVRAIEDSKVATILDPARLAKDPDFTEADAIIVQARQYLASCDERSRKFPDVVRDIVANAPLSAPVKERLQVEMERFFVEHLPDLGRVNTLVTRLVNDSADMLEILKHGKGFRVKGNQLIFNDPAEQAEIEARVVALGQFVDAETAKPMGAGKEVAAPAQADGVKDADYLEASKMMEKFFALGMEISQTYNRKLDEAGLANLLDPNRLAKDKGFAETDRILKDARSALDEYAARVQGIPDAANRMTDEAALSEEFKERFRTGLRQGQREVMGRLEEVVASQARILAEMGALMAVLRNAKGFSVDDNSLVFNDAADADAYNAGIARLVEVSEAAEALAARSQAKGRQGLSTLKDVMMNDR